MLNDGSIQHSTLNIHNSNSNLDPQSPSAKNEEPMQVQLPDGSQKDVPDNATVADVAASIGKRLAKDAIAGKVNGKVVDVYTPVPENARVEIVTPKTPEGLDTI